MAYVPPKLPSLRDVGAKPVARGQMEEVAPLVRIPTPEELGLARQTVASVGGSLDWAMVERRLDAAGATGYQMEKTADGYRFTAKFASGPVAGRGTTRGEAVRNALAKLIH